MGSGVLGEAKFEVIHCGGGTYWYYNLPGHPNRLRIDYAG